MCNLNLTFNFTSPLVLKIRPARGGLICGDVPLFLPGFPPLVTSLPLVFPMEDYRRDGRD